MLSINRYLALTQSKRPHPRSFQLPDVSNFNSNAAQDHNLNFLFFNTLSELNHNLSGVSSRMPCAAQGIPSGFFGEALNNG
jgi:hypothetical protein